MRKPAYKIRFRDLIPFRGVTRHARRCGVEKAFAERFYGLSPEQYDAMVMGRGFLLSVYNGVFAAGGFVGILIGLEKILK